MKTKKHIDRLFKEQFKHLDATPPPVVWENIAAALKKEQKTRRVVPLWYKLAGVAAALILFFGIGSFFFNPPIGNKITVDHNSTQDITTDKPQEITQPDDSNITPETQNDAIVEHENTLKSDPEVNTLNNTTNTAESIADKSQPQTPVTSQQKPFIHPDNKQTESPTQNVETDIAQTRPQKKQFDSQAELKENDNPGNIFTPQNNEEDAVANNELNTKEDDKKISLIDYIIQKKEEEELAVNDVKTGPRWEVSPNFAPVYYNTLGGGSSIDPQFSDNSKSGDVNYSYGIKLSYAFNDKLSVRTGLNLVDLSYTTNNIEFAVAEAPEGLRSIDYKSNNYVVAVGNRGTLKPPSGALPTVTENGDVIVPRNGIIPGTMKQELNYFEVPVELKYTLSNNRIGINVIGGMSTLLLNDNSVSVVSDGFNSEIGSANNLNNLSFSTNLGLGFDYKFTKRFVFNLEPVFKYQLNTYNDSAIDFNPYIFGVYSGFSYKF